MFEAKFENATTLKRVLDSIKDLVTDVNWDCSSYVVGPRWRLLRLLGCPASHRPPFPGTLLLPFRQGITLQAMDSSHVSLVSLVLTPENMEEYRCDNNLSLGINMASMTKIMKCADNGDRTILRAEPDSDVVTFVFESSGAFRCCRRWAARPHPPPTARRPLPCRCRRQGQGFRIRNEADGH